MAAFSGLYEFEYFNLGCNDEASCARGQYLEKSHNAYDQVSLARFGYCKEERTWVFSKGENLTTTGRTQYSPICDWEAKASEMDPLSEDSYDIMKTATARWFIKNQRKVVVPEGIVMKCFDCDREDICGEDHGRGKCVVSRSFMTSIGEIFIYVLYLGRIIFCRITDASATRDITASFASLMNHAQISRLMIFRLPFKLLKNGHQSTKHYKIPMILAQHL